MNLPASVGIMRKKNQAELDRMELEKTEFHERVAEGYRQLARMFPERIYTIDATLPVEKIHRLIMSKLEEIL